MSQVTRKVTATMTAQGVRYQEHIEWTPGRITRDPKAHLPSTWRNAIGKPLTDARIRYYQRSANHQTQREVRKERSKLAQLRQRLKKEYV